MKIKSMIAVSTLLFLGGCSTYSVDRYSVSVDNVSAIKAYKENPINIGKFTASEYKREIMCRGVGPIKTPDNQNFEQFIRKALIDELKLAEAFSESAPVIITGNLDFIDFSSTSGKWNIGLSLKSSNGKTMSVKENYAFTSSFYGETACNQTAQALMPAVQNLIGKVVTNPKFADLVR
ncbi:hypothetical protein MHM98_07510 [Psychrobium sp. MM17-31]|uniref:hypothetical protein n=1 Tax=Psychrobium sp. MM17-31 TaxID=2917758 RepID=UPI001EF53225|nr:hypothetical protein [Psychrobium sp. MM17-31]MCG7531199.1 hypothetical protein [Psychrobium sp. MM17-31]